MIAVLKRKNNFIADRSNEYKPYIVYICKIVRYIKIYKWKILATKYVADAYVNSN